MEATTTQVSLSELNRLLSSIVQHQLQVNIRYRTLGQLWYPNFLTLVKLEQNKTVLFHDPVRKKLVSLSDTRRIVQFELDGKALHFEPNCHYEVSDQNL